jgi:uncharacterized protein
MDAGKILGRGMSFPPRVGPDGRIAWSEGDANVRESIRVILMTDLRERIMLPELGGGLGQFLFEPNTVATRHRIRDRISKAIERWEPRVAVESVSVDPDPADAGAAIATVVYMLVATQARERLSLSITLAR